MKMEKLQMINEYDKVRLKTGEIARIVEILDTNVYLAEVATKNGDINTTKINKRDIATIIVEVERPIAAV